MGTLAAGKRRVFTSGPSSVPKVCQERLVVCLERAGAAPTRDHLAKPWMHLNSSMGFTGSFAFCPGGLGCPLRESVLDEVGDLLAVGGKHRG